MHGATPGPVIRMGSYYTWVEWVECCSIAPFVSTTSQLSNSIRRMITSRKSWNRGFMVFPFFCHSSIPFSFLPNKALMRPIVFYQHIHEITHHIASEAAMGTYSQVTRYLVVEEVTSPSKLLQRLSDLVDNSYSSYRHLLL